MTHRLWWLQDGIPRRTQKKPDEQPTQPNRLRSVSCDLPQEEEFDRGVSLLGGCMRQLGQGSWQLVCVGWSWYCRLDEWKWSWVRYDIVGQKWVQLARFRTLPQNLSSFTRQRCTPDISCLLDWTWMCTAEDDGDVVIVGGSMGVWME
jgi:hypothetical protein